jgi:hypothetical protein
VTRAIAVQCAAMARGMTDPFGCTGNTLDDTGSEKIILLVSTSPRRA